MRRRRLVRQGPQGPRIVVDGRELLAFCSNDYLGLANHPRIVEAAIEAASRHGVGEGASHLLSGHSAAHERLEEKLAEFMQMPRALLFSTGYQANIGAVTALAGPEDAIFSDALNHASLIDGVRLSRARVVRYPHADLGFLSGALAESGASTKLIVTIVYVGTLGKAAGVAGAFVAGTEEVVESVLQRARTYIYTTAAPAMLAAAVETSLELIREDEWRRERLRNLIVVLREGLRESERALAPSDTPIQPLVLGGNSEAVRASTALRERGILVPAIRPPTVPEGTARLRISLSAAHSEDEVLRLAAALREVCLSGVAAQA